jgi:hypothetical protein
MLSLEVVVDYYVGFSERVDGQTQRKSEAGVCQRIESVGGGGRRLSPGA